MDKINKIIIIILILVDGIAVFLALNYVRTTKQQESLAQQHSTELQFAKDSQTDLQTKPFLSKLPIITDQYSIYYSSLNDEIDVVFPKSNQDINTLENSFRNQIFSTLQSIGVDTQKEKIVWLKQQ